MSVIVLAGVGFSIAALTFALCAAWGFVRSASSAPRYRRTPQRHDGVASHTVHGATPFPNLLGK